MAKTDAASPRFLRPLRLRLHPLHHAKLWYFFTFLGWGSITPFLPLFFSRAFGLSPDEIGYVNCTRPLVAFVMSPLWGALVDHTGSHRVVLFAKNALQGIGFFSLKLIPRSFAVVWAYTVAQEMTCCANNALADSATGQMCRRFSRKVLKERRSPRERGRMRTSHDDVRPWGGTSYGAQRLWGAVAWGFVAAPLMGATLTYAPERVASWAPFACSLSSLWIAAVASLGMEFEKPGGNAGGKRERERSGNDNGPDDDGGNDDEGVSLLEMTTTTSTTTKKNVDLLVKETPSASASPSPSVGGAAASEATARVVDVGDDDDDDDDDDADDDADRADRADDGATVTRKVVDACFGRPAVLARLSLFSVMSASMAVTDSFLFLYLDSMGGTELLMGVALCFTCLSEVVVFAKEDWIKSRVDTERSIALVLACYAIRQLFYFALPAFPSAWFVLPAQLLHGVTFGLYWSVGNAYVHEVAPVGCNAAVMGVFGGFVSLGGFSGAFFGGLVFKRVGGGVLFGLLGCVNGALTAAMTWHIRRRGRGRGRGGGVGVGVGGGYVAVGEDG